MKIEENAFENTKLTLLRREVYSPAKRHGSQPIDQTNYTELIKQIEDDATHNGLLSDKQISDEVRKTKEAIQYG